MKYIFQCMAAACAITLSTSAMAEIVVGVIIGETGPSASMGIQAKNAVSLLPDTAAGEKIRFVVVDDNSDPTKAVRNARKLTAEENVDVLIGSITVPTIVAISEVATETKTPQIALSPIIGAPAENPWLFSVAQPTRVMMDAVVEDMAKRNVKRIGYIGFSDSWGDQVYDSIVSQAKTLGMEVVSNERYARTDTSVLGQVLKVLASKPDAVVIGAASNPAVLPNVTLVERGFKGPIYHTHGVVTQDFLRLGGKAVEGAIATTGPFMVAEQLPDEHPTKAVSMPFLHKYADKFGKERRDAWAGYAYDAYLLIEQAIPEALKQGRPGSAEFRQGLRDGMESIKSLATTQAVRVLSPDNRSGVDEKHSRVLVTVRYGQWRLQ